MAQVDLEVLDHLYRLGILRGDRSQYAPRKSMLDDSHPVPKKYAKLVARCEAKQRKLLASGRARNDLWDHPHGISVLDLGKGRQFLPDYDDYRPPTVFRLVFATIVLGGMTLPEIPRHVSFEDGLALSHVHTAEWGAFALLIVFAITSVYQISKWRTTSREFERLGVRRSGLYVLPDELLLLRRFPDTITVARSSIRYFNLRTNSRHTIAVVDAVADDGPLLSWNDISPILLPWLAGPPARKPSDPPSS